MLELKLAPPSPIAKRRSLVVADEGEQTDAPPAYCAIPTDGWSVLGTVLWSILSITLITVKWLVTVQLEPGWPRSSCVLTLITAQAESALVLASGSTTFCKTNTPLAMLGPAHALLIVFMGDAVASSAALFAFDLPAPDRYILPLGSLLLGVWSSALAGLLVFRYTELRTLWFSSAV